MGDRRETSSKEHHPPKEQNVRKKESIPSMLERGMKALKGNNRLLEQRRKERGILDTSATDAAGSSRSSADQKK